LETGKRWEKHIPELPKIGHWNSGPATQSSGTERSALGQVFLAQPRDENNRLIRTAIRNIETCNSEIHQTSIRDHSDIPDYPDSKSYFHGTRAAGEPRFFCSSAGSVVPCGASAKEFEYHRDKVDVDLWGCRAASASHHKQEPWQISLPHGETERNWGLQEVEEVRNQ
jgi:hypothetical protein